MEIFLILFFICFVILALCKLTHREIKKLRKGSLMIGYSIFYSDSKNGKGKFRSGLLKSKAYELTGKPDIIYRRGSHLIVAELKSGKVGLLSQPKAGDLMQLAAYFLIAEEEFHLRVSHGLLIYSDCTFKVRNTIRLRRKLLLTLDEMRALLQSGREPKPLSSSNQCRYCTCRGGVCR